MNNSVIILIAVVAFCAAVFIAWYLMKNLRFTKGNYGKQTVKSILKRFAFPRKYKVLENVSMELDGKTQTIDFVMVGEFGLLFVSALQGKGDFYGDFTEEYWSFVDNEKKVRTTTSMLLRLPMFFPIFTNSLHLFRAPLLREPFLFAKFRQIVYCFFKFFLSFMFSFLCG